MANRFYTIMIIPEKTSKVRKFVVPSWLMRGTAAAFAFTALLAMVMVIDYWFVMNQIGENKDLKLENRRLRQQVQVFKSKMTTVENTMDRIKTFTTRLKIIMDYNTEDKTSMLQSVRTKPVPVAGGGSRLAQGTPTETPGVPLGPSPELNTSALLVDGIALSPEEALLRKDYEELDTRLASVGGEALTVEQMLQEQHEVLVDQKAYLRALPVRYPAIGYNTSGFGIRRSPISDRVKMHEGCDIAARPGTIIRAPADGTVTFASTKSGYGQTMIVEHGYGLETWYAHTSQFMAHPGQKVRRGDKIAKVGNTGRSTGPHVHYEVRVHGVPVDPKEYILEEQ
jgi:murein DD-endopeptidase MepM/ murein hydrolase activator NlpD